MVAVVVGALLLLLQLLQQGLAVLVEERATEQG
jgi:hypothetical protein